MCCFSPVRAQAPWLGALFAVFRGRPLSVDDTRIFARADGAEQILVYSMRLRVASDVAMILPLPVRPGAGEQAVRFVSLEGYSAFFDDMASGFVTEMPAAAGAPRGFAQSFSLPRPKLVVHTVGAFDASYVPTIDDFDRLDERFRLPTDVWQALPVYADYGFAAFKLHKARRSRVHPMALRFVTRNPAALFFPTVHIHDGRVHDAAEFDHQLYFQGGAPDGVQLSWAAAEKFMTIAKARDLLLGGAPIAQKDLRGRLPNRDTWIDVSRPLASV